MAPSPPSRCVALRPLLHCPAAAAPGLPAFAPVLLRRKHQHPPDLCLPLMLQVPDAALLRAEALAYSEFPDEGQLPLYHSGATGPSGRPLPAGRPSSGCRTRLRRHSSPRQYGGLMPGAEKGAACSAVLSGGRFALKARGVAAALLFSHCLLHRSRAQLGCLCAPPRRHREGERAAQQAGHGRRHQQPAPEKDEGGRWQHHRRHERRRRRPCAL